MTEEQRKEYIAGLVRELKGYEDRGLESSAEGVRAELQRIGADAKPPADRAATRLGRILGR